MIVFIEYDLCNKIKILHIFISFYSNLFMNNKISFF